MCIECQAEQERERDSKQTIFRVQGVLMFVCYGRCRKATALARQWVFMAGPNNSERRFCKRCWTRVGAYACLQDSGKSYLDG